MSLIDQWFERCGPSDKPCLTAYQRDVLERVLAAPRPETVALRADVRALVDAVVRMHEKHTGEMANWPEWDAMSLALHALPESHVERVGGPDGVQEKP